MRHGRTKEMMEKIKRILIEEDHCPAEFLAKKCHVKTNIVYRCIRLLREEGFGVHSTKQGYIASELASKPDDVNFMRRLLGRRTSDYYAVTAAKPHIWKRWQSMSNRRHMLAIVAPVIVDQEMIDASDEQLSMQEEKLGL